LRSGENVNLKEFGNFQIIARKERKARNLKTNEMIVVPAKEVVKFKPSNKLF
jgi:nucleoid DNA-binding protein